MRRFAAFGLRRTGDSAAIDPLLTAVSDPDDATRTNAVIGLGEGLKARKAVDPLIGLLDNERYAAKAAEALAKIGDERALGALSLTASEPGSSGRTKRLNRALIDLERRLGLSPPE